MRNKAQFEGDFIKAYGYLGFGEFKSGKLSVPAVRYIDFCYVEDRDWSLALNDSWSMGGIHARFDFYLASPRTEANIVDPTYGATVTGREIPGIITFGYALLPNTSLGEVYVCTDQPRALEATFVAYKKACDAAKASGGFGQLVKRN